ncbi:hypothetical protein Pyn_29897 [Prunus yedoensis var. nudiflora]|uniref:Uncharacterized protein n=1 Tax=Prunus yedoensis var. nudiflora TaxID=2094558 RepID=A0A314UWI2_PRUYE|nr:hypothetical protein Pyn_29897 [Prunus yedoensis var. nudiflora]
MGFSSHVRSELWVPLRIQHSWMVEIIRMRYNYEDVISNDIRTPYGHFANKMRMRLSSDDMSFPFIVLSSSCWTEIAPVFRFDVVRASNRDPEGKKSVNLFLEGNQIGGWLPFVS